MYRPIFRFSQSRFQRFFLRRITVVNTISQLVQLCRFFKRNGR